VDIALLRELLGFALHAVVRRRRAAAASFASTLAAALLALAVLPRSDYTETKLLADKNLVMPALSNPQRKMPTESDTPTRLASEAIMNHTNLAAIVNSTDLVSHYRDNQSLATRAKDWLTRPFSKEPTREELVDGLVWTLDKQMFVKVGDGTVTIGVTWPDPNMAFRIVHAAQENFMEERHTQELALITESIAILEKNASEVQTEIMTTLDSMARVRESVSPREQSPLLSALRRSAPSGEVVSTQSRLEATLRTIADIEQFRNRRLAELQATLADQRNTYGAAHPQIENTQQLIRSLLADSPQLTQLRNEEQQLRRKLSELGASPSATAGASAADPLLAAAALRSLDRIRTDSLVLEKQQYSRSRLRLAVSSYQQLLERLDAARIELQTARATFKYKYGVLVPAQLPSRPVSPRAMIVLVGGLFLATMLALFTAVGLDLASGQVLETWQIQRSLGLPVLGEAPNA
jgi:uncharacterized protein involved in exopolysaccharide biosynthesis